MKDTETVIIRSNRERAGIRSDAELAKRVGIKYPSFRMRIRIPTNWRLYELRSLIKVTRMPDEDILKLVKGG